MSFDRAKALQSAQKHLAKGNLDKAIAEYERVVKADPKDARHLLKLGDIYTRKGATQDASRTYRQVAELYAEEGFFLKAVAVYKQILKLDPESLDTWWKLAEMYELLSLVSDALAAYDHIAEELLKAGQTRKAVDAMGRMVDLDSENVAACIKYAEALSKCNLRDEAASAFRKGAELLKAQGRIDDYIKVSERLLYHAPEDHDAARELSAMYLDRNDARHALSKLQSCFKADPRNSDTLALLARAFQALGQTQKSIAVFKELASVHAGNGNPSGQVAAMREVLALDPNDSEARVAVAALGAGGDAAAAERDIFLDGDDDDDDGDAFVVVESDEDEDDPSGVINLADSGARPMPSADDDDDDDDLVIVDDEDDDIHDVATGEYRIEEEGPNANEVSFDDGELFGSDDTTPTTEDQDATWVIDDADESDDVTTDVRTTDGAYDDEDDALFIVDEDEDAPAVSVAPVGDEDDEDDALFIVDEDEDAPAVSVAPPADYAADMFADAAEPEEIVIEADDDDDEPEMEIGDVDFDDGALLAEAVEAERRSLAPQAPVPAPDEAEDEVPEEITDALEEVDFYLQQGLTDEALESLQDVMESFPGHPTLLAKQREIEGGGDGEAEDEDEAFAMAARLADQSAPEPTAAPSAPDAGQGDMGDVISQFRDGVAKSVDAGDAATHYDLGIAYMEMGLHSEAIEEFKLCLNDPTRLCQSHTMIGLAHVANNDSQSAIGHFESALAAGPTEEGKLELWFELGNCYEFLGRKNDALVQYQQVEEINPEYRDVATRVERLGKELSPADEDQEFDDLFDNLILKD